MRFVSFIGMLVTAFIVLKLVCVLSWSWMLVLSPLWVPLAIVSFALLVNVFI